MRRSDAYTRPMIWERWRQNVEGSSPLPAMKPFEDLIEEAPVIAMLIDREQRVVAANDGARRYFEFESTRLPASLVEVTLEGNLVDLLRAGRPEGEAQLVHRRRIVRSKLVPGPRAGDTLMFLTDVTELRQLERVRQEFVANLVHEPLIVATDRDKLAQALGNLLDNAAKFSPSGMDVEVTAEVVEDAVRITVRDHGPGISPEHWKRVFERFYKVDRARPREAGGFGLGLAITKHLVQAIGGTVWTEAAAEGGQTFTIELPGSVLTRR